MPTIAELPQIANPVAEVRRHLFGEQISLGQGDEAIRLDEIAKEAFSHWSERAESLIVSTAELDEDFEYQHIFANARFTVKVRYELVGKLEPRRIELDD